MIFFMDTGAFIALVDAADQNQKKAADFFMVRIRIGKKILF